MKIIQQNSLTPNQQKQALLIWNAVYPIAFNYTETAFDAYLNSISPIDHYVIEINQKLAGWCFVFNRNEKRWFGIIVDSTHHGLRLGKKLITTIQSHEKELYGWVITDQNLPRPNGFTYPSPMPFYQKLGFKQIPEITDTFKGVNTIQIVWK